MASSSHASPDFTPPRSPWRSAALWAVPIMLWLALACGTGLGFLFQLGSLKSDHDSWAATIEENRREGDVEIAAAQAETMREDDLKNLEGALALGLGFALSLGAAWFYRRRVPPERRGGWRGVALGVLCMGLLAGVGYALAGVVLRGAIPG